MAFKLPWMISARAIPPLSTLRALPFNIVKLDRTFISDGTDNERGQIVARNTVTMARQLKMKIIAEGVETEEQFAMLKKLGFGAAQGYLFSRPIPMEEYEAAYMQPKVPDAASKGP